MFNILNQTPISILRTKYKRIQKTSSTVIWFIQKTANKIKIKIKNDDFLNKKKKKLKIISKSDAYPAKFGKPQLSPYEMIPALMYFFLPATVSK